jgi:glycosyltransferase involved in cell wall biosynthesis
MLLANPFTHDSRVEREARALAGAGHEVRVFCLAAPGLPAEEARGPFTLRRTAVPAWVGATGPARVLPLLRWYDRFRALAREAGAWGPGVVHGHDLETLLPAATLARRLRVPHVHDDHEVGLEKLPRQTPEWVGGIRRRVLDAITARLVRSGAGLQRLWFPRAAAVITVSPGCAAALRPYGAEPVVLRNVPEWSDLPPDPRLRERAGLPPDARVALAQGSMTESTAPFLCVAAVRHLPPPWAVVFLGATWLRGRLEERAGAEGVADRVRFLDPVPSAELAGYTRAADVGLAPMYVTSLAERWGLANKLFEYLQAGIPVVTSEGTAQADVLREADAGIAVREMTPEALAAAIRETGEKGPEERRRFSERVRGLARERWCWEVESKVLTDLYRGVTEGRPGKR